MKYVFDSSLETGHKMIDDQHRKFFQAVNDFYSACLSGKGAEEITRTMDFLEAYTGEHFAAEEQLQLDYNYPDYTRHKLSHESFKRITKELREKMENQGTTKRLNLEVTGKIADWLISHITTQDMKIAEHIKHHPK